MSEKSNIEWTDHTWSPWDGCTKVSPGCANCYAEARDRRHMIEPVSHWGKGAPRRKRKDWSGPKRWNRMSDETTVFPSLCDPFDEEVSIEWFAQFIRLIRETPNLCWLLLTKRPEAWRRRVNYVVSLHLEDFETREWLRKWYEDGTAPENVWIGTSVENQEWAEKRIPELLQIPAKKRFLSVEPMLGPVDLQYAAFNGADSLRSLEGIHWVIFGGESGPKARPCNVEWIRDGVRQCREAGVPAFVKQLGAFVFDRNDAGFEGDKYDGWPMDTHTKELDPMVYQGAPVRVLLSHPKGGDPSEWPEDLRVREIP